MTVVVDVAARLREIEDAAPRGDGVACFARLYREVTEAVQADLERDGADEDIFVERLDARFAGLFFDALEAYLLAPGSAPAAWEPLFAARARRGIAPLQFALAGMNAHINRDLPVALVATCSELGIALRDDSGEHQEFERIDALLAHVERRIKPSYLNGWLGRIDHAIHGFGRLDDVAAMWDVARARDAAWTNGCALWRLRAEPTLAHSFLAALDRATGLASRGLLLPADTVLGRLARGLHGHA